MKHNQVSHFNIKHFTILIFVYLKIIIWLFKSYPILPHSWIGKKFLDNNNMRMMTKTTKIFIIENIIKMKIEIFLTYSLFIWSIFHKSYKSINIKLSLNLNYYKYIFIYNIYYISFYNNESEKGNNFFFFWWKEEKEGRWRMISFAGTRCLALLPPYPAFTMFWHFKATLKRLNGFI